MHRYEDTAAGGMDLAEEIGEQLESELTVADLRAELAFLRHIDSQPGFYSQPLVSRAIHRLDR